MSDDARPDPLDNQDDSRRCDLLVSAIRARVPREIHGRALSEQGKVPYHAALLDAGLSYRILELAEGAIELVGSRRVVAANLLARGCLETAAVHFFAMTHVVSACDTGDFEAVTEVLFRALVGSTAYGGNDPKPIHVLTALDRVDKEFPGVRGFYDQQCEFAHPNWFGAHGAYAERNEREDWVQFDPDFSPGIQVSEVMRGLSLALIVFDYSQRRLRNRLESFARKYDEWLSRRPPENTEGAQG